MFWMGWMDWIYLHKWVFLHRPQRWACQLSVIISRRFLDAFFPEAWVNPELLISTWKAFGSRVWLISILHFLEMLQLVTKIGDWETNGNPQPPTRFHYCPHPSYLMPLSSFQFFALFLCHFWIQMPNCLSLWYLTCLVVIEHAGWQGDLLSKENYGFPDMAEE